MATSGVFNTTAYDSRYLEFAWSRTSVNIAENYSTISWTLTARGKGNWSYIDAGNFKVVIDGEVVYQSETRITTSNGLQIASGTKNISHNADGNRSFSASAEAGIYYYGVNCAGSGSWALENIPRAATITSAPDFDDTENPTIYYSNPAGVNVNALEACISLDGSRDDIAYRDISPTGNSYTFYLTEAEKNVLYANTTGNPSRRVIFYVRTKIGNQTFHNTSYKTFTITDCEPTFTFSYWESDTVVEALGYADNGDYFRYQSDLSYSVNASPKKGATITSYKVECGSQSAGIAAGKFLNIDGNTLKITIKDNRGHTITKSESFNLVNYIYPTVNLETSVEMTGETSAAITLDISGKAYDGWLVFEPNYPYWEYKVKVNNGDYGEWQSFSLDNYQINENGEYSGSFVIDNMDYRNSYTYQVKIGDNMNTTNSSEKTVVISPIFDWSKEDFNFNVPVSIQGSTINDFVVDEGFTGIWDYRLWNSGRAECWGSKAITVNVSSQWGGLYTSGALPADNFPFTFKYPPYLIANLAPQYAGGILMVSGGSGAPISTTSTGSYEIARGTALNNGTYGIYYYAFGLWK
jgi:hypothetical protein